MSAPRRVHVRVHRRRAKELLAVELWFGKNIRHDFMHLPPEHFPELAFAVLDLCEHVRLAYFDTVCDTGVCADFILYHAAQFHGHHAPATLKLVPRLREIRNRAYEQEAIAEFLAYGGQLGFQQFWRVGSRHPVRQAKDLSADHEVSRISQHIFNVRKVVCDVWT